MFNSDRHQDGVMSDAGLRNLIGELLFSVSPSRDLCFDVLVPVMFKRGFTLRKLTQDGSGGWGTRYDRELSGYAEHEFAGGSYDRDPVRAIGKAALQALGCKDDLAFDERSFISKEEVPVYG